MKRLFGNLPMTWLRVLVFAVLAGVYTGTVMLIPALKGTSFQDIGALFEWWVIFAVILVVNCRKPTEAMLKCFVFFLISQPLVYAVEILFGDLTAETAWGYYARMWLPMTLLTLPGGFLAYFCKKQTVFGSIVLGLGNTVQALLALAYVQMMLRQFPFHLLSALVSAGSIVLMSLQIQKQRKHRLIAMLLPVVLSAAVLLLLKLSGRVLI